LGDQRYEFEWDETKALSNVRKHAISFELACTIFNDPRILTVADIEHSETEERWFSVGFASNGAALTVVYLWAEARPTTITIRIISARDATPTEIRHYKESL
jgi:uncharacterized DUF497 family protein